MKNFILSHFTISQIFLRVYCIFSRFPWKMKKKEIIHSQRILKDIINFILIKRLKSLFSRGRKLGTKWRELQEKVSPP